MRRVLRHNSHRLPLLSAVFAAPWLRHHGVRNALYGMDIPSLRPSRASRNSPRGWFPRTFPCGDGQPQLPLPICIYGHSQPGQPLSFMEQPLERTALD